MPCGLIQSCQVKQTYLGGNLKPHHTDLTLGPIVLKLRKQLVEFRTAEVLLAQCFDFVFAVSLLSLLLPLRIPIPKQRNMALYKYPRRKDAAVAHVGSPKDHES